MARYRVGNKYLSEHEYEEEVTGNWIFIISSVFTGGIIYKYIVNPEWHQYIRFAVVIIPSIIVGAGLALLHKVIRIIIGIGFLIGAICLIVFLVWKFV